MGGDHIRRGRHWFGALSRHLSELRWWRRSPNYKLIDFTDILEHSPCARSWFRAVKEPPMVLKSDRPTVSKSVKMRVVIE